MWKMEYNQELVVLRIRKYRELKKISQKQLSKATGLSNGYIGDIECGRNKNSVFPLNTICRIAEALGVTLDDLAADNLNSNILKTQKEDEIIGLISNRLDLLSYEDLVFFDKLTKIFK